MRMSIVRRGTLATVVAITAIVALGVQTSALPIPPGPGLSLVPDHVGAPHTAAPLPTFGVPEHPHMGRNGVNTMHNDAYQTDTYTWPGPAGRDLTVSSELLGIEECANMLFDRHDRMIALCGDLVGSKLRVINPDTLKTSAQYTLPPRKPSDGPVTSDICGGAYSYLDNHDRIVVVTSDRDLRVINPPPIGGDRFTEASRFDLSAHVPEDDCLIGLAPEWSGRIWFETKGGVVGVIDPAVNSAKSLRLAGEQNFNTMAVDETGGVFVVSTHAMYRFDVTEAGEPAVTWRQPYDRGTRRKPGQMSQGSGTTPTLIGKDYVAITDNAEPRMNVLVLRRGKDSGGARFCARGVFADGRSATENSLVSVGDSLFVENNYGHSGPESVMLGKTTEPGMARVDLTDTDCHLVWTSDEITPSAVPKASAANGLLYTYTKPENALGIAAWYFTAIDIRTGQTAYRKLVGVGIQWNNNGAPITIAPDGTAYIATLTGLVKITDR